MIQFILFAALSAFPEEAPSSRASAIQVMSFNLRYASEEGENRWPDRRAAVAKTIRDEDPDIVGTQEGLFAQLEDLATELPEYRQVGLGRRGGSHDEACAIFFKTERFELLEFDHFWLSERPREIGSLAYDAKLPRMVTWVRLRERATTRSFFVVNTHFDHEHVLSRQRSAAQLLEFVTTLETKDPVIVTGDFNAAAETSEPWKTLCGEGALVDSFVAADFADERPGTFHGFTGDAAARGRIDWILFRGRLEAREPRIVRSRHDGRYPSDHFPVVVQLSILD